MFVGIFLKVPVIFIIVGGTKNCAPRVCIFNVALANVDTCSFVSSFPLSDKFGEVLSLTRSLIVSF